MKANVLDLSPNYAGSIMALSNGIGSIPGVVAVSFFLSCIHVHIIFEFNSSQFLFAHFLSSLTSLASSPKIKRCNNGELCSLFHAACWLSQILSLSSGAPQKLNHGTIQEHCMERSRTERLRMERRRVRNQKRLIMTMKSWRKCNVKANK